MSRVQSVERAFAVLGALADGPLGVTEIAERVRLPKSTVARLLRALQEEGAVEQATEDSRYRIGGRLARIVVDRAGRLRHDGPNTNDVAGKLGVWQAVRNPRWMRL